MRMFLAVLVTAPLLLRGVAVPHAHETHTEAPGHFHRPHVHLSGHGHHRCQTTALRVPGTPVHEPSPDHDRDAVYLDGGQLILLAMERVAPRQAAADWLTVSAFGAEPLLAVHRPQPRRVRPPGDAAPSIHTLFPHVLRV